MSTDSGTSGVKRRDFLKILGASGAAASTVACGIEDAGTLIPYLVHPDQTVPGVSNYYATTVQGCATGCGVIAETRDGRAIKLEGNPEHPLNRGAICAQCQAALQGLYNPDRFRGPMIRENGALVPTTWENALKVLAERLTAARGNGQASNAVFLNRHETGSFPGFLDGWLSAMGMPAHISYDALADHAAIAAHRAAYGTAWPAFDFGAARLIVSFGADFLDGWGASVSHQLDYADARAKIEDAPRFIYVGPRRSLTGLNADEWIAARPGSEALIAQALLGSLGRGTGTSMQQAAQASGVPVEQLERLASELAAARPSLVLAGGGTANASELATAVASINQAAGNVGTTIRASGGPSMFEGMATFAQLADVTRRMAAGQVPILMVRGTDPAYYLPASLGFADAMARVPFKVSFSSFPDETTTLCDLVLPDHHALERWGNAQPVAGTIALQQPVMNPVFNTRATADVLIGLAKIDTGTAGRYPEADYRSWLMDRVPGGRAALTTALARGVMPGTLPAAAARPPGSSGTSLPAAPALESTQGDTYFMIYPSPVLGDGSGANKPWLQELPDPVTKISWQSVIEIHPRHAERLGVHNGDLITVRTAAGTVTAAAYLYLGVREDTVAVALGRGHAAYGRYAEGIGVNPLAAAPVAFDARSGGFAWTATKAQVTKAGGRDQLATTEGSARQHGRGIAQAITVGELRGGGLRPSSGAENTADVEPGGGDVSDSPGGGGHTAGAASDTAHVAGVPAGTDTAHAEADNAGGHGFMGAAPSEFLPGLRSPVANDAEGDFGSQRANDKGMYDPDHPTGMAKRRWAMTIDLARCTGCSACITACYAENNIPTVGAPGQSGQVFSANGAGANIRRGREMTWIRLERYYEGGEDLGSDFETRFVPMLCQHCGNAPCEPVCPVYATYHSPDGLNVQVYNRCVGTRYCSNNCPYKVRYFNWFGYGETDRAQYAWPEPLNWQLNPDVTVRGKGVMEKCTFCVQRIREAEHRAALEGREVAADEFTVACAQACPSRAITFGDAADPAWTVSTLAQDRRAYHVFEELNTYTAVVYLKKVNHPAPGAPVTA